MFWPPAVLSPLILSITKTDKKNSIEQMLRASRGKSARCISRGEQELLLEISQVSIARLSGKYCCKIADLTKTE